MFYSSSLDFVIPIPLGLSNPVKPRKPPEASPERERRGKAITGDARRMIRDGAARLEKRHGKSNLAFLTCTVPALPDEEMVSVALGWPELIKRFREEIGRVLERAGLNPQVIITSEIQEKRWRKTGVIAPHIHAVFQSRKTGQSSWAVSKEKAREIWERLLSNLLGRSIDAPASTRIEKIRKSIKNYLSKYMSKGGKVLEEIKSRGLIHLLPPSWWNMTYSLRREVKDGIIKVDKDTALLIADHWENYKAVGLMKWARDVIKIWISPSGEPVNIRLAVVGEFASEEAMMRFVTG